jgi:Rieske 2Fe-2S family protein
MNKNTASSEIPLVNLTERHPEVNHMPVSTDIYWQPEIYEKEKQRIFRRAWHSVGREEQISEVGSFFVQDIPTFDMSVLIVRGKDKKIRAFLNACPHRGNQVELSQCGKKSRFACKFHSWSFDLEGKLIFVPDEEGFPLLDKSKAGLTELSCDLWEGFIFININQNPENSLKTYLGQQASDLEGYPFEKGLTRFKYEGEVNVNWKILVDSFCETYHIPFLHRRTIKDTMAGPGNPHGRAVDVRIKGDHRTVSVWGNRSYEPKSVQGLAANHSPGASITSQGSDSECLPIGLNETRSENWSIDVSVFFPNLVMVIGSGMYFTHQMWPLGPNRTRWEMTGYLRPASTSAERFGQEHAVVELRDAVLEDAKTLERIQRNLNTGLVKTFHFHDHELMLRYQHYSIRKHLGIDAKEKAE